MFYPQSWDNPQVFNARPLQPANPSCNLEIYRRRLYLDKMPGLAWEEVRNEPAPYHAHALLSAFLTDLCTGSVRRV